LRYFNACGYDIEGKLKTPEREVTNLIPVAMETLIGKRNELTVFGSDYDTPDGTCIRDYIHVTDLSDAHIKALDYITETKQNLKVNLGQNKGISVLEVIDAVEKNTGKKLKYNVGERRFGDPAKVYTSYNLAKKIIGWEPKYSNIDTIIKSTYDIYKK
jgi:UDP-glucose 4-epimerase